MVSELLLIAEPGIGIDRFCCQEKSWSSKCPIIRQVMTFLRQERAKRCKMLQVKEL